MEPVVTYLMIAQEQYKDISLAGSYNVGPDDEDCWTTGDLVNLFCKTWNENNTDGTYTAEWINQYDGDPHEANFLKLDCSKIKLVFNWKPTWHMQETMEKIVEWSEEYMHGGDVSACMKKQIEEFIN